MSYSKYTKLTLFAISIVILLSLLVEFFHFNLMSFQGDLTRVGMHSESDYGGNEPEYAFNPALSRKGVLSEIGQADVIVMGDSFSTNRFSRAWHNYLQSETGLRVMVFDITKYDLEDIISNVDYKKNPPKILIYESVERNLPKRSRSNLSEDQCSNTVKTPVSVSVDTKSSAVQPQLVEQRPEFSLKIDRGLRYLKNLLNFIDNKTAVVNLSSKELFTNSHANRLLIFNEDINNKKNLSQSDWEKVRCGLFEIQAKVQKDGKTQFVALIAPDKLTAYSQFLENKNLISLSKYRYLTNDQRLNIVPLLTYFESAHRNNKKDIYFPNDTHWSSVGNKIVGYAILDYLKNNSMRNQ